MQDQASARPTPPQPEPSNYQVPARRPDRFRATNAPVARPIAKAGSFTATVLTTEEQLEAIKPAWNDLYARCSAPRATLSFEWVSTAWRYIAEPQGARLCVLAVHSDRHFDRGRLLAVWPMSVRAYHRLWRRARQLCTSWDYNDILIDPDEDAAPLIDLAWDALTRASGADLITLTLVPVGSPLQQLLAAKGATITDRTTIHTVAWDRFTNWQSYYRGLSHRAGWDRHERRLREQGQFALGAVTDADEAAAALRWMLEQKRRWLDCKGKSSDWLHSPDYEAFLIASLESVRVAARMVVFTLTLDGRLVAVKASLVDQHRMFWHHTVFDPAFGKYSPGIVAMKFMLNWAFERNLTVDLGYGQESNKAVFGSHTYEVADFMVVSSTWGQCHQALKRYTDRYRPHRIAPAPTTSAIRRFRGWWREVLRKFIAI